MDVKMPLIKKVNFKEITYKKSDEKKRAKKYVLENITATFPSGVIPVKVYDKNGEIFLYCSDKKVYKLESGVFGLYVSQTYASFPYIEEYVVDGEDGLVISDGAVSVFMGEEESISLPSGKIVAYFSGRFFVAEGRELKFSTPYDYSDFSYGDTHGGLYKTEKRDGDIIKLTAVKDALYCVCQKSIIKISAFGDISELKAERLSVPRINIVKGSVSAVGNETLFISCGKLFSLKDGKVKKIDCKYLPEEFTVIGEATCFNNTYVLPVSFLSEDRIFLYDVNEEREGVLSGITPVCDGEYLVKDNKLYRIKEKSCQTGTGYSYLTEKSFGTLKEKSLSGIEAEIAGSAKVKIHGEFGEKEILLKDGCNDIKCNLVSRRYDVEIGETSSDFVLYDFKIKYKVIGG